MNRIIDITKWIWKLNILLKSKICLPFFFSLSSLLLLFFFTISFNTLVKGILNNSFPTSDKNKRYASASTYTHTHTSRAVRRNEQEKEKKCRTFLYFYVKTILHL